MVERIRLLLETRQLSPTQFADAIGIARPIVSHILSGRNKPSLEVVQRILAAMPDLSMPWLLNGTGPMLAAGSPAAAPVNPIELSSLPAEPAKSPDAAPVVRSGEVVRGATKVANSRPAQMQSMAEPAEPVRRAVSGNAALPKRFTAKKSQPGKGNDIANAPASQPVATATAVLEPVPTPVLPAVPEETSVPGNNSVGQLIAGSDKPIRRIVIFYRDGSFADFQPE